MGFCVGQALCCAGSICCSALCCCCSKVGVPNKNFSRIGYVFFQIVWIGVAIGMMFSVKSLIDWFPSSIQVSCPSETGAVDTSCLGASAIIRMSFVLVIFHSINFLIILARNDMAAAFHDGCWLAKSLFVLAAFIGSMWIPNQAMINYLHVSEYMSAIFLLYQGLLMLVVAYKINETLVNNYNETQDTCSGIILAGMFTVITILNIVWVVFQFKSFTGSANVWIQVITLVGVILMYILVIVVRNDRPDASVLTSAIAGSYLFYLQWSSLSSNTDAANNKNLNSSSNTTLQIFAGLTFTIVCLIIISSSSKAADDTNIAATVSGHMVEAEEDLDDKADIEKPMVGSSNDKDNHHVFAISQATILFQFLLIFSAMYMAMLCTNWASPSIFDDTTHFWNENSDTSYYIKLVSLWVTQFVYIFSLVAPLLFPDRDFS